MRDAARIVPRVVGARFAVGAPAFHLVISHPDGAVGVRVVLRAACRHVAFDSMFRRNAAQGLTSRRPRVPGASEMAQILHRESIHAGADSIRVGGGVGILLKWPRSPTSVSIST